MAINIFGIAENEMERVIQNRKRLCNIETKYDACLTFDNRGKLMRNKQRLCTKLLSKKCLSTFSLLVQRHCILKILK